MVFAVNRETGEAINFTMCHGVVETFGMWSPYYEKDILVSF